MNLFHSQNPSYPLYLHLLPFSLFLTLTGRTVTLLMIRKDYKTWIIFLITISTTGIKIKSLYCLGDNKFWQLIIIRNIKCMLVTWGAHESLTSYNPAKWHTYQCYSQLHFNRVVPTQKSKDICDLIASLWSRQREWHCIEWCSTSLPLFS